ncbi:hypothetical protein [Rhizobium sp. AG855]|uniref:hypothetical protein n=1 Tax=Rhizobium sp. AG855 TaxID=2183898 RepID=UPI000E746B7B|nr:hypothetical protein [Rhizobium sp. AG855]RKE80212.1 hypothetical protein DFO46_3806 [Rhizobium sp. AG855]
MSDTGADILVSQSIPAPLRIVFAVVSAALAILIVTELSPGLWPISFVTPFFAVIVGGGLVVLAGLFLTAVTGLGETWHFRPGLVEIDQRLLTTRQVFVVEPGSGDCRILRQEISDSAPSWHIVIDRAAAPMTVPGDLLERAATWLISSARKRQGPGLVSPGFGSEQAAEEALALLLAKGVTVSSDTVS